MRTTAIALVVGVCVAVSASDVQGGQPLLVQVSPSVMQAPGFVVVRALVDASDDNRRLEIAAESADFARASAIDLDGRRTPRLSVFQYTNLPAGVYVVRASLVGTRGPRASTTQLVRILPGVGPWRR